MPQGYTTIPSGRTHVNHFPCLSFRPDNFYGKASLRLQEQEQQRTLQKPHFSEQAGSAEGSTAQRLVALTEALTALGIEIQCTISDPAALNSSLISSRPCSRQSLKTLAAALKPTAIKPGTGLDDALGVAHLRHLFHSLQSKAVMAFERSCETMQLQTPLLPQATVQVELLTSIPLSPALHTPVCRAQACISMYSLASACDTACDRTVTMPSDDVNQ